MTHSIDVLIDVQGGAPAARAPIQADEVAGCWAGRLVEASGSDASRRGVHYDWMDFHSISELSREW